ncbi:MAG TPA: superoxide dismutase [Burkholderiales bacterium]|nr:superoxide dismutase [Burkholderiales bacterium]
MYETATATIPSSGTFTLPPLPFDAGALAPVISRQTLELHHDKHHRAYIDKLNELVTGREEFAGLALDELVKRAAARDEQVFNNAGQAWNHQFYWRSLAPDGGTPSERLRRLLDRDLGGYDAFVAAFTKAATAQFGSGWAWLVVNGGTLAIETTSNADSPLLDGRAPLLAVDVWEHAYYLDYQNRREEHVRAVVEKRLNWEFADQNLRQGAGG